MLEIERRPYIFKTKEIWFSDYPFDVTDCDSVTFRDCKNRVNINGFYGEEFNTLFIDLRHDLKEILKDMDKSSCRDSINRAIKEGIKVKANQGFEDFFKINRSFRRRKGLPPPDETTEFMKRYGTLFIAELDGEILAGQLYLEDEDNIRWLVGASRRLEVNRKKATLIGAANRLIIWEAIKYAKDKKIKEFDFGGYYMGEKKDEQKEGINLFKKSFGGRLTKRYIYQRSYSKIHKLAKKIYRLKKIGTE